MATSKTHDEQGDAITMLTADHKRVRALFKKFSSLKDDGSADDKAATVEQVCMELTVHATLEEEIFYPAVRKAIEDGDLMDEALVEHASAKQFIAELESMDPDEDLYDAKVTVLAEQIEHHVKEEEGEMFAQARKAKVDVAAVGGKMLKRKRALMAEMGITDDERADAEQAETGATRAVKKASRSR